MGGHTDISSVDDSRSHAVSERKDWPYCNTVYAYHLENYRRLTITTSPFAQVCCNSCIKHWRLSVYMGIPGHDEPQWRCRSRGPVQLQEHNDLLRHHRRHRIRNIPLFCQPTDKR